MAMIELPFTAPQFFDVFRRYNETVWPAQWILYGVATLIVFSTIERTRPRMVLALLAVLWLWMAVAYHIAFFAAINPVAFAFGGLFVAQAVLFLDFARSGATTPRQAPARWAVVGGRVLVSYALLGYPLIGYWAGQRYPEVPTFGVPCPTTILTLGVLVSCYARVPWWLATIPIMWSGVGTAAALQLSVPGDFGLTLAGLFTLVVFAPRWLRRRPRPADAAAGSYPRPTPRASATRLI